MQKRHVVALRSWFEREARTIADKFGIKRDAIETQTVWSRSYCSYLGKFEFSRRSFAIVTEWRVGFIFDRQGTDNDNAGYDEV